MTRRERLFDLLSDRALVGLSADEESELVALMAQEPGIDIESFERAASAVALAGLKLEPMPEKLAQRIEVEANAAALRPKHLAGTVPMPGRPGEAAKTILDPSALPPMPMPQPRSMHSAPIAPAPPAVTAPSNVVPMRPRASTGARVVAIAGWLAAAACLALAIGAWKVRPRDAVVAVKSAAAERDDLLKSAGTARLDWAATTDTASRGASGDVVWNAALQRGYMRFRGLAKNDPRGWQYQLWIFDKTRDDKYPVDGGVFDVDAETGDVVVPIKARLPVNEPALFAVTVEKPGGVVVSKRERIVVTAKPAT
ncbi:MAG TPA: anti-sigma factor [Labilithrix sp.]